MKPQERDPAYLWDMREAAKLVQKFLRGKSYTEFSNDPLLRSGVERQLEIIGEAARRISSEFQKDHSEIPWRSIIGLRNILIHEYGEVKLDRLWLIATTHMPALVDQLEPLIPPVPGKE
jgi:uncharacterized protein with HEPN domain